MCVQYRIKRSLKELSILYGADLEREFEFKERVFPRYEAPVLGVHQGRKLLKPYFFGLIPFFEKSAKPAMVFHNARVETLHEKPSFRGAFPKQRCLIPLDEFFEYLPAPDGKKNLARIFPAGGGILTAAGLYSRWESPEGHQLPTFAMITRPAPSTILEAGHDRCPFFLRPESFDSWLSGEGAGPVDWYQVLESGRYDPSFDLEIINSKNG